MAGNRLICDTLALSHFDGEFMRRDLVEADPLTWLLEVDGLLVDIRRPLAPLQVPASARATRGPVLELTVTRFCARQRGQEPDLTVGRELMRTLIETPSHDVRGVLTTAGSLPSGRDRPVRRTTGAWPAARRSNCRSRHCP